MKNTASLVIENTKPLNLSFKAKLKQLCLKKEKLVLVPFPGGPINTHREANGGRFSKRAKRKDGLFGNNPKSNKWCSWKPAPNNLRDNCFNESFACEGAVRNVIQ